MEKIDINIFIANLRATTTILQQLHYLIEGRKEDVTYINQMIDDYNEVVSDYNELLNRINTIELNTYTKNEINSIIAQINNSISSINSSINTINNTLETKADKSTTYTKTETDTLLDNKANASDVYSKNETYSKTETDNLLDDKANASDVYSKNETYTKTETDNLLASKANTSDVYTKTYIDSIVGTINLELQSKLNSSALAKENVTSGTIDEVLGYDSNGNLIRGTVSGGGGQTLYKHHIRASWTQASGSYDGFVISFECICSKQLPFTTLLEFIEFNNAVGMSNAKFFQASGYLSISGTRLWIMDFGISCNNAKTTAYFDYKGFSASGSATQGRLTPTITLGWDDYVKQIL